MNALLERLRGVYPNLEFDEEEFAESLSYKEFLSAKTRARLNYDITQHKIYRTLAEDQALDRLTLTHCQDPFDPTLAASDTHWQSFTSGTSGSPMRLLYASRFYFLGLFETVPASLEFAQVTLPENERLHVYITDNPNHALRVHFDPRDSRRAFLTRPLRRADSAEWNALIDELERLQPHTLASKPNLFGALIEHGNRPRLKDLRALFSSGAHLNSELRRSLDDAFGVPIVNSYVTSEGGYLGTECPVGKIHLISKHARFKVRTPNGALADSGKGDLVMSSYLNDCMPLKNYLVGDQVELESDGCACGRNGPYLREFTGRTVPVFALPSGKSFSPTRWMRILSRFPHIREFQITQKADLSLSVRLESAQPLEEFREGLADFLSEGLSERLPIRFETARFLRGEKLQRYRRENK